MRRNAFAYGILKNVQFLKKKLKIFAFVSFFT